jgi:hypothetical protein
MESATTGNGEAPIASAAKASKNLDLDMVAFLMVRGFRGF